MDVLASSTLDALQAVCAGEVRTRITDLAAYSHDASHYLMRPQAVVIARDVNHVADLLRVAGEHALPVTFRSGGTSLSGQAGSNGLLVDTRRNFRGIQVLDEGRRVRCQPGSTLGSVNARLAPHQTKLGPDPASEAACTIGGIIANNSSGMACGTALNAYRTVESMTFVLPSGTVINTAELDADLQLRTAVPALWAGLGELRDRIRASPDSLSRIADQYLMKNTMGYAVNSFIDHDSPVDILSHLIIGSEGTLAFVGEVVFRSVEMPKHLATVLLMFDDLSTATAALPQLLEAKPRTIELMDARSLRVIQRHPAGAAALGGLDIATHTALLVEIGADTDQELVQLLSDAEVMLKKLDLTRSAAFTSNPSERAALWQLRKGLYTAVAGARPAGTTALLEDIVVPLEALTESTERLTVLLERHGYDDAVIFGHAKDANLHFMITPRFDVPEELRRYEAFTEDLVDLVLSANGSLKAEHGTGRVMAPYVRRQFGDELYDVMKSVKALCDPSGVLNPGVLLTDNASEHLANLKSQLPVHEAVDTCVECGFCESVCPSQDVTTTPRQRIALMREIRTAGAQGDEETARTLREEFDYDAVDTCTADSMCVTACPVAIDTGAVMRGFRTERAGRALQRGGKAAARHWAGSTRVLRTGLRVSDALPARLVEAASNSARKVLSPDWIPQVGGDLPGPGPRRPAGTAPTGALAVHFAACVGSIFGPASTDWGDSLGATGAMRALCDRVGVSLAVPERVDGLCCGTPWKSKGLDQGYAEMANRTFEALWRATDGGRLPVVSDASSCALGLQEIGRHLAVASQQRLRSIEVVDAVTFARTQLLERLDIRRRLGAVALHPTCASEHLGSTADLQAIAAALSERVVTPTGWRCCGFAGDRGLLHPEVTASATARQAAELADLSAQQGGSFEAYVSNNRTCEIGMSRATGHTYQHILELLEFCTR